MIKPFAYLCAVTAGITFASSPEAFAGWTGTMNGVGFGRASVNVTASTGAAGSATSAAMTGPGAAMKPDPLYNGKADLPSGAYPTTTAKVLGASGYKWTAFTQASNGDRTDNSVIESLVTVIPQDFAFLDFTSELNPNNPLQLHVFGTATGGTAFLVQGFNWTGDLPPTDEQLKGLQNLIDFRPYLGSGDLNDDPTNEGQGGSNFNLLINLPDIAKDHPENFYLTVYGYATSAVPEGGSLLAAFVLTLGGLVWTRETGRAKIS